MSRPILADAFDHHVWATLRLLDTCLTLTPDQLATTVPGTFGSILETQRHIVGADVSYLVALTGGRRVEVDDESMDVAALRAEMERNGPHWAAVAATAADPDVTVTRHRDDGTDSHAPLGIRLAQALHHGTDHRSQICTALTALGIEPPAIDAWDFAETQGRLSETPAAS